jgi:hypothetical protein
VRTAEGFDPVMLTLHVTDDLLLRVMVRAADQAAKHLFQVECDMLAQVLHFAKLFPALEAFEPIVRMVQMGQSLFQT